MNDILIKPVSDTMMQNVINQWVFNNLVKKSSTKSHENNATQESNQVFSIDRAREFTGNNDELAYELFKMFQSDLDNYIDDIRNAVDKNSSDRMGEIIHKLHGASRCCGTIELLKRCEYFEKLIQEKKDFNISEEAELLLTAIRNVANYKLE